MHASLQQPATAVERPRVGVLDEFNCSDPRYHEAARLMVRWAQSDNRLEVEAAPAPEEDNLSVVIRAKIRLRMRRQRQAKY